MYWVSYHLCHHSVFHILVSTLTRSVTNSTSADTDLDAGSESGAAQAGVEAVAIIVWAAGGVLLVALLCLLARIILTRRKQQLDWNCDFDHWLVAQTKTTITHCQPIIICTRVVRYTFLYIRTATVRRYSVTRVTAISGDWCLIQFHFEG